MARAVTSGTRVYIMSSGLLDTSSCSMVGILIDGALELLQELVDVQKVALCSQVRQWQGVGVVHWRMRSLSDHCATVAILGHTGRLVAAKNGELHALETHQTLANVIIGRRVNSTTLGIAEELIESIVCCTLTDLVVIAQLLGLVDSIVNGAIGRILGWASIESGGCASRMLLAITSIGTKGTIRILVSTRCSGKRLQVSNDCDTG